MTVRLLFCLGLLGLLAWAGAASEIVELEHGGVMRQLVVERPGGQAAGPMPLLIALHDVASSGRAMQAMTGLSVMTQDAGMIAAYPSSHGLVWDSGRSRSGMQPELAPRDDVGFVLAVIEHLAGHYDADPDAVYLVGLGDGGAMAFELACMAPGSFRAVVVVGALLWTDQGDGCAQGDRPPSILMMQGGEDGMGQDFNRGARPSRVLDPRETLMFWAAHSGCDTSLARQKASVLLFDACRGNASIALVKIDGAGHHWLRRERVLNSTNVSAEPLIGAFFSGSDWLELVPEEAVLTGATPPRSYYVYAPSGYDPDRPTPLVLVLHGRPDTGLGIAYITDMNPLAERESFIAVYPNATELGWNYLKDLPNYPSVSPVDDVVFLRDLTRELALDFNLDPERQFVAGFSNGGFMTELLACTATDTFAAFAVVGATLVPEMAQPCSRHAPAPILYMHGTEDVSISWNGTPIWVGAERRLGALPAPDSFRFWAFRNGCAAPPEVKTLPELGRSPGTVVHRIAQTGCLSGHDVVFYAIEHGGHNWPGVPGRIRKEIAGRVNQDIHASEVIWQFFEDHPLMP